MDRALSLGRTLLLVVMLVAAAPAARALEALDGRIQAHGFFESQLRVISDDFSGDYDLAQWHQVLNVEVEVDILPEGWGYIDLMSAYVRIEGRYDCVYSQGCGMIQGADTYGNKARNLPARIANGHESTFSGAIPLDRIDTKVNEFLDTDGDGIQDTTVQRLDTTINGQRIATNREVLPLGAVPGFSGLADQLGADGYKGTAPFGNEANGLAAPPQSDKSVSISELNNVTTPAVLQAPFGPGDPGGNWALMDDDPFDVVFERFEDFRFAHRGLRGGAAGGMPVAVMGPWLPKNFIEPNALLADIDNPFDATVTPDLLTAAAYNGSIYSSVAVYGLDFSPSDIDPDDPSTFLENDLLAQVQERTLLGGLGFQNLQNGARITAANTADGGAGPLFPNTGLLYTPPPNNPLFPRLNATQIAGIGSSVSPNRRSTAKPFRPVPVQGAEASAYGVDSTVARGVYLPSRPLRNAIASGELDRHPFNISQTDRAWNRGSSQDEGELKEAYVDIETWDSRLWLRLGKQNIVWGKTELFRTTDQFNPVDLALVTLGNLEETRIALWAGRAVLSLYEVGPFDDVRFEVAANIDEFESNDFGACGEPFAPNPVCDATFGTFAHGIFGVGLAGVDTPDAPWEDASKIEFGARIEWRWNRFSFALADFYGYEDLPYVKRISTYERNVDPLTGRMRVIGTDPFATTTVALDSMGNEIVDPATGQPVLLGVATRAPCATQPIAARQRDTPGFVPAVDEACLQAGPTRRDNLDFERIEGGTPLNTYLADLSLLPAGIPQHPTTPGTYVGTDPTAETYSINNALDATPVNQQFFAAICAGTVGVSALDPAACAGTIFGSQQALPINANLFRLAPIIGNVLTGSGFSQGFGGGISFGVGLIAPEVDITAAQYDRALTKLNRDLGDAEQGGSGPFGEWRWATGGNPADPIEYLGSNFGCVDNALLSAAALTRVDLLNPSNAVFGPDDPIPCHSSGSSTDNLGLYLTPEQQALLGCGPFFGTNCGDSGIDLLNADASVLFGAFVGFDGTANAAGGPNFTHGVAGASLPRQWTTTNTKHDGTVLGRRLADDGQDRQQPGTLFFQGGPVGRVVVNRETGEQLTLPGARSPFIVQNYATRTVIPNPAYNPRQDGCIGTPALYASLGVAGAFPAECASSGSPNIPLHDLEHPLAGNGSDTPQYFSSEMMALSYHFMMLLASNDGQFDSDNPFGICEEDPSSPGNCLLVNGAPVSVCSFATPQNCGTVRGLIGLAGLTRNTLRAGGDGTFGRRTFVWQSGGEAVLAFARRNVLGFSGDFAEDVTGASFSLEATWINDLPRGNLDSFSGVSNADEYNVTLSIDRPTFVNFLNANRTFFFNTQWFFRYRDFSSRSVPDRWDLLGTFTILAGYFQDRLLPSVTFVYDIRSNTGAVLPQVQYRYTEAFSIVVGAQFFAGRPTTNPISVNGLGPVSNQQGQYAYRAQTDAGVSIVRHVDNFFVRLRYAF